MNVGLGGMSLAGVVSGASAHAVAGTPGTSVNRSNANTYGGGIVTGGSNTALGTGAVTLAGGTLSSPSGFVPLANAVTVLAQSTLGGGGVLFLNGNVTLSAALTSTNSGFLIPNGTVTGSGSYTQNIATGSTTVGGTGVNSFSGGVQIVAGGVNLQKTSGISAVGGLGTVLGPFATLAIAANNQINGGAAVTVNPGGTSDLNTSDLSTSGVPTQTP